MKRRAQGIRMPLSEKIFVAVVLMLAGISVAVQVTFYIVRTN